MGPSKPKAGAAKAGLAKRLRRLTQALSGEPPTDFTPKEQKALNRLVAEESFRRSSRQCRLRILPLSAIFPGIERLTIPLSAINVDTGHGNHAEMQYVVAVAQHRGAERIFEFGTFLGRTTYHFAHAIPDARVWTLDLPREENPWAFADHVGSYLDGQPEQGRVTSIRTDARRYDPTPLEHSMDFVWVDGDHSYEGVKSDTTKAMQLLKPGGVIMWHDFAAESPGLVDFFVEFTERQPLFHIQKTSVLLHIDGVDPLTFEAAPVPFAKTLFKPSKRG